MNTLFPDSIILEYQEQKSIKQESKTRKNTRKHAKYDLKNAEEALIRAKSETNNENQERYCMDSFRNSADSTEKNGKVLAEMIGIEKTIVGNREIRRSHSNVDINNALKNHNIDFIDNDDAEFLDSFASHKDGCGSTHSELGYGEATPNYDDAKRALQIAQKANEVVNKKEKAEGDQIFMRNIFAQIDQQLQKQ